MRIVKVHRNHLDTTRWDDLINNSFSGSVQAESWYIDTVTEDNWWACCVENDQNGELIAGIPLYESKKMGNVFSRQPLLSKYWGVHVRKPLDDSLSTYQKIHFVKKHMTDLVKVNFERVAVFDYFTGIDPVYPQEYEWQKAKLGYRFTYTLSFEDGIENVRAGYSKSVKKRIRKLRDSGFQSRLHHNSEHLEQVLMANAEEGRSLVPTGAVEPLTKLSEIAVEKERGFFLSTYNANGDLAAAGFWVHDNRYAYFMSGYVMPEFRKEQVMSLLVDDSIERSSKIAGGYDFFGSSIESIESFFRSFGSEPKPYFRIIKAKFPFNLVWKL